MVQMLRTVGPKGQVVVPKDIRRHFNIRQGTEVSFSVKDHEIVIRPLVDPKKIVEEFCKVKLPKMNAQEIKKILDEQYEERLGRV